MRSGTSAAACWALLRPAVPATAAAFAIPPSLPAIRRVGRTGRRFGAPSADDVVAGSPPRSAPPPSRSSTPPPTGAAVPVAFVSPTFRVYIEDTDAYGVMYNGNYLRCYERALCHVPRGGDGVAEGGHASRWILTRVSDQKFRSSPALGGEYVVRGERIDRGGGGESRGEDGREDGDAEVWKLEMASRKDGDVGGEGWIVHNSATATFVRSPRKYAATAPVSPLSTNEPNGAETIGREFELCFTPYHDEFDVHYRSGVDNAFQHGYHIPLRNAMNFFERARSTRLGGPDVLRRMQEEEDLLWVVTGADDGELLLDAMIVGGESNNDRIDEDGGGVPDPAPGREVIVRTDFDVRRRGMIVDCRHRLYAGVDLSDGRRGRRLLARATVTIMALRGSTRRPTSKLPRWILDRLTM